MLRFLARFLAAVCAALFVCAAVTAVFLRPIGSQLLAPQVYKDVLREQRVAERFPELAADTLSKAMATAAKGAGQGEAPGDFAGWLQAFPTKDMQTLIGAALPADYVGGQLEGTVDQFFRYVDSNEERPSVKLSFVELKRRLASGVLEDAYVNLLQGKPACVGAGAAMPVGCCPPAEALPEVRARFREMVGPAARELPDSADLFAVRDAGQAKLVFQAMDQVRQRVHLVRAIARWSWVLPALLLLGVTVFAVRSFRGLLLWWGIPCVLAGGLAALLSLPSAALGGWVFRVIIAPQLPAEVPVLAVEAVLGVVTAVAQSVFGPALKAALWLVLGGLVAVVVSLLFRHKAKPQPPALG